MRCTLFLLALLALSGVAVSDQPHGSWKDAKVTDILAHTAGGPEGKGYLVVTFAANGTGTPNCASGYPRSVVIDLSTQGGAFAAAIVQSALLLGSSSLTVTGTGACSVTPTIETAASVQENSPMGR
jgi:hypothetical protein